MLGLGNRLRFLLCRRVLVRLGFLEKGMPRLILEDQLVGGLLVWKEGARLLLNKGAAPLPISGAKKVD